MFKKPTRFFEELINSNGKGRTVMTALENFTPLIGGIPIVVEGQIVGGVGVSGAASAQQDEAVGDRGLEGIRRHHRKQTPILRLASPIGRKAKVEEAFAKGSVLFDGSDGRNYMVHASRREKPGQAEVHTKDADVIYVLDGSATFMTGGEAIEGRPLAPDEIRGKSIKGARRENRQGRCCHCPPWGSAPVPGSREPFLYYVVKVR